MEFVANGKKGNPKPPLLIRKHAPVDRRRTTKKVEEKERRRTSPLGSQTAKPGLRPGGLLPEATRSALGFDAPKSLWHPFPGDPAHALPTEDGAPPK